ncbi:DUF742 domain-containing protein [Lentzea sp. NPDC004782]|uniref:DUF742 domain-containing protein n=1 Tax=Lentzea sp. NPDC004782 TaxID=3154458 RepID=UPI0033ABF4D7
MIRRPFDDETPDRLYAVTGGRSRAHETAFDLVTLIISEGAPSPGMQSEHIRILRMCHRPMAVVEISAALGLPVSVVKILLCDLLDTGRVSARHPSVRSHAGPRSPEGRSSSENHAGAQRLPNVDLLKKVLVGLQKL